MKYKLFFIVFLTAHFVFGISYAHEGEKHGKEKSETTISKTDSMHQIKETAEHHEMSRDDTNDVYEIEMPDMLLEHPHNKIVHFVVALSIAAFLFTLLNFKWRQFDWTIKILVLISSLAASAAYFSGTAQATPFLGEPIEWVVDLHRTLGIISASSLWLWLVFLFVNPLKKYAWIIGAIIFVLVSITGFYGGILATS